MTSLHAYFYNRDQAAFQRQLAAAPPTDINARDWLGRTVLHLACAASDPAATEYVRMLLSHPGISVNLQDVESHWTALHRALYNGNLAAAILLLQRSEIDTDLKDVEGYRAFDLYNTTVENTMPNKLGILGGLELYTWGTNRNASLGHGDTDDRIYPEQVVLRHHDETEGDPTIRDTIAFKLRPSLVEDVQMSRLHTVVVTDEPRANIRACGFASTGRHVTFVSPLTSFSRFLPRLGPGGGQHTQPSLLPIQLASQSKFTAVALGQDHTLALTSDGTVFSWGLGRFSQLGYDVPAPHVQTTPRVIAGPLRRERVRGIAACKSGSACWTDTVLFTWGKNNGQLGYDKTANPVQPVPKVVTKVTKPIISVALNDAAMACLLATQDVVLLFNDAHARITFPSPTRPPSNFLAYRSPQAAQVITTAHIFCNENMFATVSSAGEIFIFNVPTPLVPGERPAPVQPQRVWALRKQWSAVHDAALGGDGSLIICTESGHVFVRSRSGSAKAPRFARVMGLQRAVAVRASDTGALAALCEPYRPPDVTPVGNNLAEDVAHMRPYLSFMHLGNEGKHIEPKLGIASPLAEILRSVVMSEDEDEVDASGDEAEALARDAQDILCLWDVLAHDLTARRWLGSHRHGLSVKGKLARGADLMLRVQGSTEFPVHTVVLSARCAVLARILGGLGSLHDRESGISLKLLPAPGPRSRHGPPLILAEAPRLAVAGVHPFSVLVLLHYLYIDVLLAVGDPRLTRLTAEAFARGRLQPAQVVRELQTLSRVLHLDALVGALRSAVRREPSPSLNLHFRAIFDAPMSTTSPDVMLHLADRDVWSHSFVLRARSLFFECFFADEDWTMARWEKDGTLRVDLRHLEWCSMQYVLRFMCCGEEAEMFERLEDFVDSTDQLLDLLFGVMFAANELLLDRLLLICSSIVVKYVNINNISAVYLEVASLNCDQLVDSLHQYMAVNMETLLEGRLLDDLPPRLVKQLAGAVRGHQAAKSSFARLQLPINLTATVHEHREWLAAQDIPYPIVRSQPKVQKKLSPTAKQKPSLHTSPGSKPTLPRTPLVVNTCEDLFAMDEALVPPLSLDADVSADDPGHTSKAGPWKGKLAPRVDMKAILAEAEEQQASGRTHHPAVSPSPSMHRQRSGEGMGVSFSLSKTPETPHSGSPNSFRAALTPAWRNHPASPQASSSPPGRATKNPPLPAQPLARAPSISVKSAGKTPPSHFSGAPMIHKSWSTQSSPSSSTHPSRPGLGPVISPPKVKGGLTATRHASGNAWNLPLIEPVSRPSSSVPISFAEIQQLQSQPNTVVNERRSLRDIQAEEAELQAEVDFMKWWTAEEERIRLENEAMVASLTQPKKLQQDRHHQHGKKNRKSAGTSEGDAAVVQRASRGAGAEQKGPGRVKERVPPDGKKSTGRS
ncbi:hypothetical protein BJV78DRAFT_1331173 [Lactifluus subvellereus]|nr:hypothetical protein BJV78DRAFT_1331173 [Lactifluus subvellereus]